MYSIKIFTDFSAAHFLRGYKGKCESLHGHNWKVEVSVTSHELDSLGMIVDFSVLKRIAQEVTNELDHININDLDFFSKTNPSSENIAKYIFLEIKQKLKLKIGKLEKISVWETDSSCAAYQE